MIIIMVTELIIGKIVINMRDIGKMVSKKEKEPILGNMVLDMRDIG